jgi:lactoylglutathione lyase
MSTSGQCDLYGQTRVMNAWPSIETITLFVEDLGAAKRFYQQAFGLDLVYEDSDAAVFRMGGLLINLLVATAAHEVVEPAAVGGADAGNRFMLTIKVDDVGARCQELAGQGVALLNGPVDRPWGRRTASLRDPAGHVWELAQEIG